MDWTRFTVLHWLRLGLFPIGYGLTGALVGGTLNRVMIAELGLSASLVGFFFALPLLESPVRLWLGYRSDGYPLWGRRREPYVVVGAWLSGLGVAAAVAALVLPPFSWRWAGVATGAFLLYGFGRNLGHNIFQALLADVFSGTQRPRAVTGYEVASVVGLIVGAGVLGQALEVFDPDRLLWVTVAVAALVGVLSAIAVIGQEPRHPALTAAADRARSISFAAACRELIAADPQVRRFFALVLLTVVGTMAQDVLLEPFGALALEMSVGDTTRLTMFWGVGVLLAMLVSGGWLIPRWGQLRVLRLGLLVSIAVFAGVVVCGAYGKAGWFRGLVLAMGLGTGLAGAGMLTAAINFTSALRAGLLMGLWGMANLLGKAFGSVLGGGVVDLLQRLTAGNAVVSYSAVFVGEALLLAVALRLSFGLDVNASRVRGEEQGPLPGCR